LSRQIFPFYQFQENRISHSNIITIRAFKERSFETEADFSASVILKQWIKAVFNPMPKIILNLTTNFTIFYLL